MQEEKREIVCSSIPEAEKKVYKMILQQTPQNKIAETEFVIDGISRRFNPVAISKIKKKFEESSTHIEKDYVTAELFKLFREGHDMIDVVIKTQYPEDFVEKKYEKYLNLESTKHVTKEQFKELRRLYVKWLNHIDMWVAGTMDISMDNILDGFREVIDDAVCRDSKKHV